MIKYRGTKALFTTLEGSVVPFAMVISVPCMILSAMIKYAEIHTIAYVHVLLDYLKIQNSAYSAFSSLLGFLIVFRTSQAYSRYWQGSGMMQQMIGSWFDSASSAVAFCHRSQVDEAQVVAFQHLIVRLFSLLTALALTELMGTDDEEALQASKRFHDLKVIDGNCLDHGALMLLRDCPCKVELIFHWIQTIMIHANAHGTMCVAPPVLSRTFIELADGMTNFCDCKKLSMQPFPFPYSQLTVFLLLSHWVLTPVMICSETKNIFTASIFSFLMVFIYWCLYAIAAELENPFGDDPNDLDAIEILREMNDKLLQLIIHPGARSLPSLSSGIAVEELVRQAMERRVPVGFCVEDQNECNAAHEAALVMGFHSDSQPTGFAFASEQPLL